jgi:hypothetical protein
VCASSAAETYRIRLIHWRGDEAEAQAERLCASGYEVDASALDRDSIRAMRADPPSAIVVDLSKRPSQGRDVGLTMRKYKDTRHVPLVFCGGAPEKVARLREHLPDAVYTTWDELPAVLAHAIAHPLDDPVVPGSVFDVYAGTPLPKKLGIKPGWTVLLAGAPERFEDTLGPLPEGARLCREPETENDLVLWFLSTRADLERDVERMGALAGAGGIWIVWPKRSSGVASDLTQNVVRQVGLASGLVDFKICSVDKTWSGLRFTRRKPKNSS